MKNSEINSVDEINEYFDSLDYEFSEDSEIELSEDSEIEDSEPSEIEDSEVSETSETDVSFNNQSETFESSGEPSFQPNITVGDDYLSYVQSEILDSSSNDYTIALEDLKTSFVFLIALLLGLFCALAFIKGISNQNEC